jgi:recombinational DNA repair protein (RecF pathway)
MCASIYTGKMKEINGVQCICVICDKPSDINNYHIVENCMICDNCMKNVPDYIPEEQIKKYFYLKKPC